MSDSAAGAMPLILASASPRRRELLAGLGVAFEVRVCPLNEPTERPPHVTPRAWAEAVAYYKGRAAAEVSVQRWTLSADTIVVCEGAVLGKPRDEADAAWMLRKQAGRGCDVITGVCLLRVSGLETTRGSAAVKRRLGSVMTRVWMRDDPAAIDAYVRSGDWAGKAGAYGIQDVGDRLVERIEGSFSNVVGLPLELVEKMLRGVGR